VKNIKLTLYEQEGTGLSFRKRELLHLATVPNLPYNSADKTTSWFVTNTHFATHFSVVDVHGESSAGNSKDGRVVKKLKVKENETTQRDSTVFTLLWSQDRDICAGTCSAFH